MFSYIIPIYLVIVLVRSEDENVCRNMEDYANITNNPNCWYDYMIDHDKLEDVVRHYGYDFEEHKLTTPDGYILTIHRIPNTNHKNPQKSPVYLHHGYSSLSSCWVVLRNESLAFMLADEGYDVWMANMRGNIESMEHSTLKTTHDDYWKYCLDEIAAYDTPMTLSYISKISKSKGKIIWIGHSLGSAVGLTYASESDLEAKKFLKVMILLGPAVEVTHTMSPLRMGYDFADLLQIFLTRFGLHKLISNGRVVSTIFKTVCYYSSDFMDLCTNMLYLLLGTNTGPTMFPLTHRIIFQGASFRTIIQVIEGVGKFGLRKWNYGPSKNMALYGNVTPPTYDLGKVKVPVHLVSAKGDWLTGVKDTISLFSKLKGPAKHGLYIVPSKNFNHLDYIVGIEAKHLVNDYISNLIKNMD